MLAGFLITLREGLEAALIIGIIAAYIARLERKDLNRYVNFGILSAIIASSGVALIFRVVYGELQGTAEQLFEGLTSLAGAVVLTYMIFWMANNSKKLKGEVQEKINISISRGHKMGIATLSFFAVFREGVETVLFLGMLAITAPVDTILGFAVGLATAIAISFMVYRGIHTLDLAKFFRYTSILLIMFSAGLVATAVHEFNEAGIIPEIVEHAWDINPPPNPDGSFPLFHENGLIGGSLKALVGYYGAPSLTMVLSYISYWIITGIFVYRSYGSR